MYRIALLLNSYYILFTFQTGFHGYSFKLLDDTIARPVNQRFILMDYYGFIWAMVLKGGGIVRPLAEPWKEVEDTYWVHLVILYKL